MNLLIFPSGQQNPDGVGDGATGPAHLLIVGHDGTGRLIVHDEAQIRLVVTHAQRRGRHQGLDPVGQQQGFQMLPVGVGVGKTIRHAVAVISAGRDAVSAQPVSHLFGIAAGQGIHDAGSGQFRQMLRQPGQSRRLIGQAQGLQGQGFAHQRTALDLDVAQLLANIPQHPVVGGRCGSQHGHVRRHPPQHVDQTAIIGTEVMTPVGDAVSLVHHQQAETLGDGHQHLPDEFIVSQTLGRNQHRISLIVQNGVDQRRPVVAVGGIDGQRPNAQPLGGFDLVPHQGQQRRDDQRRPETPVAQQPGRDEIDHALAPTGALHDQPLFPPIDQGVNRFPLAGVEIGRWVSQRLAQ